MFYERKLDNLGRLTLPTSLIRCTISIFAGDIAFCYKNENEVILKDAQETVETDMILFIEEIDEENRITLPLEMEDSFQKFMIYIQNHELILRGGSITPLSYYKTNRNAPNKLKKLFKPFMFKQF